MKIVVALLLHHFRKIDGVAIQANRRASLHAVGNKTNLFQLLSKSVRCLLRNATAFNLRATNVHQTIQKSAVCKHNTFCSKIDIHQRVATADYTIFNM